MSNLALKNSLYSVSTLIAFQPSQGLIQMTWGSKEECHCPSAVWGGKNFWPRCYTKKTLYTLSNLALKNSLYSFSTLIAFQPSQGLIQRNWGSKEECHCPSTVWGGNNFWPRCYTKKVLYTLSNFALKNSLYSVSTKIAFQPGQGLIQMNWGSKEECHCPSTVWGGKNFWPRCYTKKVLYTLSNLALKTRYIVFQHKLLFNLVKDLFKWIEGLWRSVTVRAQSEGEEFLT